MTNDTSLGTAFQPGLERALDRFVSAWSRLSEGRRWTDDLPTRRFAAVIATSAGQADERSCEDAVESTIRSAAILREESRTFSDMRSDSRWAIGASLTAHRLDVTGFVPRFREMREAFRRAGIPREELREASATVELLAEHEHDGTARTVEDFVAAHGATGSIRSKWWPHTEYGLTAVTARLWNGPWRDLRDDLRRVQAQLVEPYSFAHHGLRSAAQIAVVGRAPLRDFPGRFRRVTAELSRRGLRMNSHDHVDVAMLAASDGAPEALAGELVDLREELRLRVHPRVGKQEGFHLTAGLVAASRGMAAVVPAALTTTWRHDWTARHAS